MSDQVPMTRDRYHQIRMDIERLESVEMPVIAEKIALARAEGDLKENAEYHAQRENQGMMQAKINQLKVQLANAYIRSEKFNKMKWAFGYRYRYDLLRR